MRERTCSSRSTVHRQRSKVQNLGRAFLPRRAKKFSSEIRGAALHRERPANRPGMAKPHRANLTWVRKSCPAGPAETHALQFMYTSKWLRAMSRSAHFFQVMRGSIRKDWPVAGVRCAEDAAQSERLFRTRGNKAAPAARDKGAALISDAFPEAQPEEPRVNLLSD